MKNMLLILFIVTSQCVLANVSEKSNIAVMTFTTDASVSTNEAITITDRFQTEILGLKKFTVLERNKMDVILQEQGFQQTGACNTTDCSVEVGQLLGVDRLIVGSLGKLGNIYTVNVKMIDVATGEVLQSRAADFKNGLEEVLTRGCKFLSRSLINESNEEYASDDESTSVWWWIGGGAVIAGGVVTYLFFNSNDKATVTTEQEEYL